MSERQVITSLTGTIAPLLTCNSDIPAALDYCSFWLPRDWKKSTPFVTDLFPIAPNNQSLLNAEMNFEFPKVCHLLFDLCVRWIAPPRTVAPAGNPAFYVDHLGYAALDYFRIHFGSNLVYQRENYDLYFKYRQLYTMEKRDAVNELIGGDQTIAQRTADLTNGREYWTDMMLPFGDHFNMACPIVTLSQKTRFVLKTRSLLNLINTPIAGTTVTTPSQETFELWCKTVHLTGNEGDMLMDMSNGDSGISYMIHQNVRQSSDDFASSQTGFQINCKLSGMTKPLRALYWALIPRNLVNDTGVNDIFFFTPNPTLGPVPPGMNAYSPIQSWSIDANGQIIQRQIFRNYNRVYDWYKFNESPHGDEIFGQRYSMYPHSTNSACGYLDYTTLSNPVLRIVTGVGGTGVDPANPANPQTLRVIVNAEDYNFWFFKSGNWSRTFN